jgi:hypothetical protein
MWRGGDGPSTADDSKGLARLVSVSTGFTRLGSKVCHQA